MVGLLIVVVGVIVFGDLDVDCTTDVFHDGLGGQGGVGFVGV